MRAIQRARTETVALDDACGRVLAEAIASNIELPVADVSAMDGYAFTANSGDPSPSSANPSLAVPLPAPSARANACAS